MMDLTFPSRPLLLASASPRRTALFHEAGLTPDVHPSAYEETVPFPLSPPDRAMFFAMGKALDVRTQLAIDRSASSADAGSSPVIIGADTIVVFRGSIMEKPKDKEDGMQMLMALSGNTHQVITGVCLCNLKGRLTRCFYESSDVTFCRYTEEEMDAYLSTDEAYDKAGGYGIQGTFSKYVTNVHGDIDNIIGFPMKRFLEELPLYETILRNGRL